MALALVAKNGVPMTGLWVRDGWQGGDARSTKPDFDPSEFLAAF